MAEEFKAGCQRPATKHPKEQVSTPSQLTQDKGVESTMIKVGKPAPDFSASAFHKGKFVKVNLSEYLGKWILLCFYPGDFTFV
jgi:peroxiredoxin (alkyl hydroperoxide reductase subunit C)